MKRLKIPLAPANTDPKVKKQSQLQEVFSRLRKRPVAMISLAFILLLFLLAISADLLYDYTDVIKTAPMEKLQPASAEHLLGTDQFGRDFAARIVHGVRTALLMGVGSTLITIALATVLACLAAYYGGKVDMLIMRAMDILASIPGMIIALAICAGLGNGMWQLIVAMAFGNLAGHTRLLRSKALSVAQMDYIESAVALGAKTSRIILKYVVPNIVSFIIIQFTGSVSGNIMMGATLSFIGLGVKAPRPEWGVMISEGLSFMTMYPGLILYPGIALVLTAMFINTFGDALRDALDPQLKGRA